MRHRTRVNAGKSTKKWRWKSAVTTTAILVGAIPGLTATAAAPAAADSRPAAAATTGTDRTAAPQPPQPKAPPGVPLAPRDDIDGLTAAQHSALRAARDRAAVTGQPVTVDALTTPTATTTANPAGTTTYTSNLLPVRVRKGGSWTPVDATLRRNTDGTYSPAAAAGGLKLSGGGDSAPLASMGKGREHLDFSWPAALPAPEVSGDALTYPGVLPDVDLKVTATTLGGFSEVLIVKTAAAAANPRLRTLTLRTQSTGLTLRGDGDGGLEARRPGGNVAYSAPQPLMWDSARPADVAPGVKVPLARQAASADPAQGTVSQPGAHIASVTATPGAGTLRLSPDASMLSSHATVYPLYIDPTWNPHPASGSGQHWNEVQSASDCRDGTSNYDSTRYGDPGVGYNGYSGCIGVERSYFQLGFPSSVWSSHIVSAVINTTETYAAQCSTTSTINMYLTSAINSAFSWNTRPAAGTKIGSHSFAAACSSYISGGFPATSVVARAAAGHWSALAFVLINANEGTSDAYHFKRFSTNPSVSITYNHVPSTPGSLGVKLNASTYGCATTTPYPILGKTVATTPPSLDSVISDPDKDAVQATYSYWVGSGAKSTLKSKDVSSGQHAPASFPSTYIKGLADGTVVNWQVSVSDGEDSRANSAVCHFTVDQRAPAEPTVTSSGDLYPDIDSGGAPGAAAGTPGTFVATVSPGTTNNNASAFIFGLDAAPPTSNPPTSQKKTASGNSASYDATPVAPGTHTLYVYALDSAGNESPMHEYHFTAVGHVSTTYASLGAAFDNTAVSDDSAMAQADADGSGYSYSLQDLEAAGWQPGGKLTVDGADLTLPDFGSGSPDNVLAANQQIEMHGEKGDALVFLASSTYGVSQSDHVPADHSSPYVPDGTEIGGTNCSIGNSAYSDCTVPTGTITYGDQTAPQPYYMSVPTWDLGPGSLSVIYLQHINHPTGQTARTMFVYAISVPLARNAPISSVTLPDVSDLARAHLPALHIFGMAVRDTTSAPNGTSWTGAWSSPSESGVYNFIGGDDYGNRTFRLAMTPSVSGNSVRVKLSNRGNSRPLAIDHATLAQQLSGVVPTGTPTDLTFGGATAVTLPAGGEAFSDPLAQSVTVGHPILVSFHLTGNAPYVPEHSWASSSVNYLSAAGSGDHSADTTNSAFTDTGTLWGWFSDIVTGMDVVTDGNQPTVVTIGDGLVDTLATGTTAVPRTGGAQPVSWRLNDQISRALRAGSQPVPNYGVVAADIPQNRLATYVPGSWMGGRALLTRLDYDVFADPNITTVVINEGLQDIVSGADDTTVTTAYQVLLDQLQAWGIKAVVMNLTPCDGYTKCTAAVDDNRLAVNEWISDVSSAIWPGSAYVDANAAVAVDDPNSTSTPAEQQLSAQAAPLDLDSGDHVNLSVDGYTAVSGAITADLSVLVPPPSWCGFRQAGVRRRRRGGPGAGSGGSRHRPRSGSRHR